MIYGKIGFRFETEISRPDQELIEEFKKYPTPNIADAMGRFRVMDPGIRPVSPDAVVAGPALTVMVRPGDNLMLHKAWELAKPGDVIVVNTFGNSNNAVFGGLMMRTAIRVGVAGIIVDGAIRDREDILEYSFPAFSRSVVGSACDNDGPGEINFPISCGGVVVCPGDIIVASVEGIVVVPAADAEYILEQTKAVQTKEMKRLTEIESGKIFREDINRILHAKQII
jgi:regulator of RNase E activity RraA